MPIKYFGYLYTCTYKFEKYLYLTQVLQKVLETHPVGHCLILHKSKDRTSATTRVYLITLRYFPQCHGFVNIYHIQKINSDTPIKTSNTFWISINAYRYFEAFRLNINYLETKYSDVLIAQYIIEWISTSGDQWVADKWWSFLKYTMLCRTLRRHVSKGWLISEK